MRKIKDLFIDLIVILLAPVWFMWGVIIGIVGIYKGMTMEEALETYFTNVF